MRNKKGTLAKKLIITRGGIHEKENAARNFIG